jgi:hypothetical protein
MTELRTIPQPRTCRICGGKDDYINGEWTWHRCRIDLDAQRER